METAIFFVAGQYASGIKDGFSAHWERFQSLQLACLCAQCVTTGLFQPVSTASRKIVPSGWGGGCSGGIIKQE